MYLYLIYFQSRLTSESWFDNWVVEGLDRLAHIEDLETVEVAARSRVIPEVVPFLVPEAHDQQIVAIGEREVDEVSELSEKASVGSLPDSSSSSSSSSSSQSEVQDNTIQVTG